MKINEIKNPTQMKMKPIKEKMDIYVPDIINENISKRNGMVSVLTGSGGSGKSSLMLNMMKDKTMYRGKFHNIFYFCPSSSFNSVQHHPFEKHERVYHELTIELLDSIYNQLIAIKEDATKKEEKKEKAFIDEVSEDEEEEKKEIQYSLIIIDDMANYLK
jgi:Tfp pilus assembly ATPase PilU